MNPNPGADEVPTSTTVAPSAVASDPYLSQRDRSLPIEDLRVFTFRSDDFPFKPSPIKSDSRFGFLAKSTSDETAIIMNRLDRQEAVDVTIEKPGRLVFTIPGEKEPISCVLETRSVENPFLVEVELKVGAVSTLATCDLQSTLWVGRNTESESELPIVEGIALQFSPGDDTVE